MFRLPVFAFASRAERGHPPSSVLTIRYIAHTDFAKDYEFGFRVRPDSNGKYLVCSEDGGRGYVCD